MNIANYIHSHLRKSCPFIYATRLDAVMKVACALQKSNDLSLTAMGRQLKGTTDIKHKIKKVDRLEGNKYLHEELGQLYAGLSEYVFKYLSQDKGIPIIIDLCFIKDMLVQMLSAEVASKGRTIPLYREIFNQGELKGRASLFLNNLKRCIPNNREVIIIMDAGFQEEWFAAIESTGWNWIARIREGKSLKLSDSQEWISIKDFISSIKVMTKNYNNILLFKEYQRGCRVVTIRKSTKKRNATFSVIKNRKVGSGTFSKSALEPWILATNLTDKQYKSSEIIKFYSKRMQIEESFIDIKSHQFGLSARYVRTTCAYRWGVKMLLSAIVQIIYWIIGIVGHNQGMQRFFQANTVKDRKVFSYFTLGKLIIEHDVIHKLDIDYKNIPEIIERELACA